MRQAILTHNRHHYEIEMFGETHSVYDFQLQNSNHPDSWHYTGNITRNWKQWYPTQGLTTWWNSRSFTARVLKPFWVETKGVCARMKYDVHHGADDTFNTDDTQNYSDKKNLAQMIQVKNALLAREQRQIEIGAAIRKLQNSINNIVNALNINTNNNHIPLAADPTEQNALNKINELLDTCALHQGCDNDRSKLLRIYNRYRTLSAQAAGVAVQRDALDAKLTSLGHEVSPRDHIQPLKDQILRAQATIAEAAEIFTEVDILHRRGLPDKAAPIGLLGLTYAGITVGICFALGPLGLPAAIITGIAFLTGAGSARAGLKNIGRAFWHGAWGNLIANKEEKPAELDAEPAKPNIKGLLALAGTYATVGAIIGSIVPGIGTLIGLAVGATAGFILGAGTGIGVKNIINAVTMFIIPGLLGGLVRGMKAGMLLPNRHTQTIGTVLKDELRAEHPSKITHIGYLTGVITMIPTLIIREIVCAMGGLIHGLFTLPAKFLNVDNAFSEGLDFWNGKSSDIAEGAEDESRFRSPLGMLGFGLGSIISVIPAILVVILKGLYLIGAAIKNDFFSLLSGIGNGFSNGLKRGWNKAAHQERFSNERNVLLKGETKNRAQWVGTWIGAPLPWIISGLAKGLLYRGWVSGIMNGYHFIAHPQQTWRGQPDDENAHYGIKDSFTKESVWTSTSLVISLPLGLIMTVLRLMVDSTIGLGQRVISFAYAGYFPNTKTTRTELSQTLTCQKDQSWIESLSGIITTIPAALIGLIALTVRGIEDIVRGLLGSLPAYAQLGFSYIDNQDRLHTKANGYRKIPEVKSSLKNPLIGEDGQTSPTIDRPLAYYASYLNPLGWITAGISALVSGAIDGLRYGFNFGSHYLFSRDKDDDFGEAPNLDDLTLNFITKTPVGDLSLSRTLPAKLFQLVVHTIGATLGGLIAAPIGLTLRVCADLVRGFVGSHALLFWCDPSNANNQAKAKEPFTNLTKGIGASFAHLLALCAHAIVRTTIVPLVNIFSGLAAGFNWLGTEIFQPESANIYSMMRKATAWRKASELSEGQTPWKSPIGAAVFFISSGLSILACVIPFACIKGIQAGIDWLIEHQVPDKIAHAASVSFKATGNALYSFFIESIRDGIQFGAKTGFYPGHAPYWQQAKDAITNNGLFSWPLGLALGLATALPSFLLRISVYDPVKASLQGLIGPFVDRYREKGNYLDSAKALLQSSLGFVKQKNSIIWDKTSVKPIQALFLLPALALSAIALFTIDLFTSTAIQIYNSLYHLKSNNHSTLTSLKDSIEQSCGFVEDQPWQFKNIQPGNLMGTLLAAIPSLLATVILKPLAGFLETSIIHTAKRIWNGDMLSDQFSELKDNYNTNNRWLSKVGAVLGCFISYPIIGLYDLLLAGPALAITNIFQGIFNKPDGKWLTTLTELSGFLRGDHLGNVYRALTQRPFALVGYLAASLVFSIPTAIIASACRFFTYGLWNGITKGFNNSLAIGDEPNWSSQSWLVKGPSYLIGGMIGLLGRAIYTCYKIIGSVLNSIYEFAQDKNPLEIFVVGIACLVVAPAYKVITAAFKWLPILSAFYQGAKLYNDVHNAGSFANLPSGTLGRRLLFSIPFINVICKIFAKISKQIAQAHLVDEHPTPLNSFTSFFASPKYQPEKANPRHHVLLTSLMKYLTKAQRGQVAMNGTDHVRFDDNKPLSTVSRVKHSLVLDEDDTRILKRIVNMVRNGRYTYTVDGQHQNRSTDGAQLRSSFFFNKFRQPSLLKKNAITLTIAGHDYRYSRDHQGVESLAISSPAVAARPIPSATPT